MHTPNKDTQAKIFEAKRESTAFFKALHEMELEDVVPLTAPKPPKYTDTILKELITFDSDINAVKAKVRLLAPSNIPILILGETGTGKELIAKALHGARDINSFIAVNCGAIPENLLESEFFGHMKGSFTGAIAEKRGLIEEAKDGTLFLDEVGDIPYFLQAKLLRVLETNSFRKVGAVSQEVKVNFRLVAATNYLKLDSETKFRSDLYYRIAGSILKLKPLRERPSEDIPFIVRSLMPNDSLVEAFLNEYKGYNWLGNIRELLWKIEEFKVLNII